MRKTAVISGIFLFLLTAVMGLSYLAIDAEANAKKSFSFVNQDGYEVTVTIEASQANGAAARTDKPHGYPSQDFTAGTHVAITALYRNPSGYGSFFPIEMLLNTATGLYNGYYRDTKSGVGFAAMQAVNLDTWAITLSLNQVTADPLWSGSRTFTMPLATIQYYDYLPNGNGGWPGWSCFVINGIYSACQGLGYPSASIFVSVNTKCQTPGAYDFTVSYNGGVETSRGDFYLYPEVPPEDLMRFSQGINYVYDDIGPVTISQAGCGLTSSAMVLYAHGERFGQSSLVTFDPTSAVITLNDYLRYPRNGFDFDTDSSGNPIFTGNLFFNQVTQYGGAGYSYAASKGKGGNDPYQLKKEICGWGPQILEVKGSAGQHFVVATSRTLGANGWTWKIMDPGYATNATLESYGNTYLSTRRYKHIADSETISNGIPFYIWFRIASPADLVVTAPDGKKAGFDPVSGRSYSDIPNSYHEISDYTGHEFRSVEIGVPADGEYTVQVIGIGTGTYNFAAVRGNNYAGPLGLLPEDRVSVLNVPITPGETHVYSYNYIATSAVKPILAGGFDGGGQKPSDVNKFLRYIRPADSRLALPAGTASYKLTVSYGATVIPGTLKADLDGVIISQSFNPAQGKTEDVVIPLKPGSNTLTLSIDGATQSGRTATDTDRFTFIVK